MRPAVGQADACQRTRPDQASRPEGRERLPAPRRHGRNGRSRATGSIPPEEFGRGEDANDSGRQLPARHGQNDQVIALGRKARLFSGSDRGGDRAALMYSLIATAKLNSIDPQAWLTDVLDRIAATPASRLDDLLPWNWSIVAAKPPDRGLRRRAAFHLSETRFSFASRLASPHTGGRLRVFLNDISQPARTPAMIFLFAAVIGCVEMKLRILRRAALGLGRVSEKGRTGRRKFLGRL